MKNNNAISKMSSNLLEIFYRYQREMMSEQIKRGIREAKKRKNITNKNNLRKKIYAKQ